MVRLGMVLALALLLGVVKWDSLGLYCLGTPLSVSGRVVCTLLWSLPGNG